MTLLDKLYQLLYFITSKIAEFTLCVLPYVFCFKLSVCNVWRSVPADLSKAKRNLSNNLQRFKFECIGNSQTEDEIVIGGSLREFAQIIDMVEDERERMVSRAEFSFKIIFPFGG